MKALRAEVDFLHKKQTYTVTATRPDVGDDVDVAIVLDGKELHHTRVSCRVAFGSGVCRAVFQAWLNSQRPARATDRRPPEPAKPRLFGSK